MIEKYDVVGTERTELGRFAIRLDTIRKGEKEYPYSYIESKDSVAILAEVEKKFVLIKQYRHSVKEQVLEIPGGTLEEGEEPIEVAKREMLEETGYELENIVLFGSFYPSVGSSYERCYLYYAECGKKREQHLEPLEYLNVELLSKEEIESAIVNNELQQSMALVAWMKYKLIKAEQENVD